MLCSQQGYFHSGTSFRVVTWYSSTIENTKIKKLILCPSFKELEDRIASDIPGISVRKKQ